MATLKEYDLRLRKLRNIMKLARTMKMVAAGKFRKAQLAARRADEYAEAFERIIARAALMAGRDLSREPLAAPRHNVRKMLIVVFGAERGLCGGFAASLASAVAEKLAAASRGGIASEAWVIGKRSHVLLRQRGIEVRQISLEVPPRHDALSKTASEVTMLFVKGYLDEVSLVFARRTGAGSFRPDCEKILPVTFSLPERGVADSQTFEWRCEPDAGALLGSLLERRISVRMTIAALRSAEAEEEARMLAMDSASRNAEKLFAETLVLRNRSRQNRITMELLDIMAGAEALRT